MEDVATVEVDITDIADITDAHEPARTVDVALADDVQVDPLLKFHFGSWKPTCAAHPGYDSEVRNRHSNRGPIATATAIRTVGLATAELCRC
jgi:hypothetical protein